eukprot:353843-Chlamydomonas_euryale.AAC.6
MAGVCPGRRRRAAIAAPGAAPLRLRRRGVLFPSLPAVAREAGVERQRVADALSNAPKRASRAVAQVTRGCHQRVLARSNGTAATARAPMRRTRRPVRVHGRSGCGSDCSKAFVVTP